MCDQAPDEILLNGKRVAIEPLPIVANESVAHNPEDKLKTTADARGYVAYWALIADRLYLIEVRGCYRIYAMGPVFAGWVSGTIRPPEDNYDKSFALCVDNGVVLN